VTAKRTATKTKEAKKHPGPAASDLSKKRPSTRKRAPKTANDLMLEAWKYTYKHRHERLD